MVSSSTSSHRHDPRMHGHATILARRIPISSPVHQAHLSIVEETRLPRLVNVFDLICHSLWLLRRSKAFESWKIWMFDMGRFSGEKFDD